MYAKVFRSMFYGSLAGQADAQLVLVCLLTHSDRDGYVELPAPVIAALSGLPLDRVLGALAMLESPDPASRTEAHEGRRLERTGAGRWLIVNYLHYRDLRDDDQRREQNRLAQARRRERLRQQASASVSTGQQRSAQADEDADAVNLHTRSADADHAGLDYTEETVPTPPIADEVHPATAPDTNGDQSTVNGTPRSARDEWLEAFTEDFWAEYPRKVGKPRATKAWLATRPWSQEQLDVVCAGLHRWVAHWRDAETQTQHIPHPATWLNDQRWNDTP